MKHPGGPPVPDPRQAAIAAHNTGRQSERTKRLALLEKIAKSRNSAVIGYVTANRVNLAAQIGMDVIRLFRDHLGQIGKVDQLDLILITRGGHILAPLRLISLLREFAKKVAVLVPYMAHSAGTLIALGANEIVMGAMGELGPVDPSVTNTFNPVLAQEDIQGSVPKPRPRIPISVEDVTSYIAFAKDRAKLEPAGMADAVKALTSNVHPLALGNILRNHSLIRHVARRLLAMQMGPNDGEKIDAIVKTLSEELYTHDYVITRDEAPKLGLMATLPSADVEDGLWELFRLYENWLGIDRQIDWAGELGQERQKYVCYDLAVLESQQLFNSFSVRGTVLRKGGQNEFEFNAEFQGWEKS